MLNNTGFSDSLILEKIINKDVKGWEYLYDGYAALMLTVICQLTADKLKGEKILIKIFTAPKFEDLLCGMKGKIGHQASGFSFNFTLNELRKEGIEPDEATIAALPKIFQMLYLRSSTVRERRQLSAGPVYKTVFAYKWLPAFGVDMYA